MGRFLDYIAKAMAFLQLVPGILDLIAKIQGIVGPGNGPVKKALVMAGLPEDLPAELAAKASAYIDKVVGGLKEVGLDAAGQPIPPSPPGPAV